jgi:hypothetical protein
MSDPIRLRDQGPSDLERALLDAGMSYRSNASTRAKTLAALGVAGSATLLAGAASAAPVVLAKASWAKLLAAVSLVSAAVAVPSYYVWHAQSARHAGGVAVASAKLIDAPKAPVEAVAAAPVVAVAEPAVAPAPAAVKPSYIGRVSHPSRAATSRETLAHELASIDGARGMLARGDAPGALARLDAYGRAYPHGHLGLEAEVLRIDALRESGRSEAARTRAEAFLERHPRSVLAAHVRTRLGD